VIEEEEIGRIVGVFVVVGRLVGEIRLGDRVYDGWRWNGVTSGRARHRLPRRRIRDGNRETVNWMV
jgi:hypothetical protein